MKKTLLLLAFFVGSSVAIAQKELSADYSYTVSNPYKVFDAYSKSYFSRNGQIMAVKVEGDEIMIQKFNSNTDKIQHVGEKLYKSKDIFPKNYQLEEIVELNDKYYFFYSSWDGDNEKEQLYVREIDFSLGEFVGESKLVFKVDGKVTGSPLGRLYIAFAPAINIGVQNKFDFLTPLDKNRLLIQYRKKPEVKSDTKSWDIIGMNSFDGNLNMISNHEVKMPYTERRMNNLDYAIDGEGNTYILTKVFHDDSNDDKKRRKDTEANYHIELFRIKAGSKDIDITKVEVKDKFINKVWVYESPDNNMICAGFYNNGKEKRGFTDGIFMFKAGKEGGIYDMSTIEIPLDVLNEYERNSTKRKNARKEEKGEAQFENLELRELLINKEDGSIVLIGEEYFKETIHMRNTSYTRYNYNDLLIAKVDTKGNLAWMKKLPKRQRGADGKGGMSYKHIFGNGNHYLLFLDNVKNYNLPLDETPATHSDGHGGYFTSYKIADSDGTSTNSSVFNVRDVEDMTIYQFATKRIVQTGENQFALEVYKKKKEDVMIKVSIK